MSYSIELKDHSFVLVIFIIVGKRSNFYFPKDPNTNQRAVILNIYLLYSQHSFTLKTQVYAFHALNKITFQAKLG